MPVRGFDEEKLHLGDSRMRSLVSLVKRAPCVALDLRSCISEIRGCELCGKEGAFCRSVSADQSHNNNSPRSSVCFVPWLPFLNTPTSPYSALFLALSSPSVLVPTMWPTHLDLPFQVRTAAGVPHSAGSCLSLTSLINHPPFINIRFFQRDPSSSGKRSS